MQVIGASSGAKVKKPQLCRSQGDQRFVDFHRLDEDPGILSSFFAEITQKLEIN